jgi:TM2 domain-containing membrane protein YozV
MARKYCSNCGIEMNASTKFCPECGAKQSTVLDYQESYQRSTPNKKNPGLAAVLSFLIVGLGQIYNGQIGKGLLLLVAAIISGVLWLIYIGIIFSIIIWIYAIYDAYNTAKRINAGEILT